MMIMKMTVMMASRYSERRLPDIINDLVKHQYSERIHSKDI